MKSIFSSLKIVELASVLAGPSVGMFFAELGAKVTKVENKASGGDMTRQWKLSNESESSISAYYSSINYHKKIVFKDLKSEKDRDEIYELIKESDIVLCNFKEQSAIKLGMNYDVIKSINSRIIYANISGFEYEKKRVAFDMVMQAETGFLSMTGLDESNLAKMPVALIDVLAAHQLKEGILTALWMREKEQKAYYIDCSLEKAAISSLVNQASNYLMAGHISKPMGTLHPNIAPYGEIYISRDNKRFTLAIGTDHQFEMISELMKIEFSEDFANNNSRLKNRAILFEKMDSSLSQLNLEEIKEYCTARYIPFGEIKTMDQVLESKTAQEMILEETIEGTDTKRIASVAFNIK